VIKCIQLSFDLSTVLWLHIFSPFSLSDHVFRIVIFVLQCWTLQRWA